MAKPLTVIPPSSSVAKLLEPGIGAAALRPVASLAGAPADGQAGGPAHGRPIPPVEANPTGEPADVKREFTLTRTADATLNELLALYQRATGCKLHSSHLMRALLHALGHALPELEQAAATLGALKRPRNAAGQEAERDEFEARIAKSLLAGLRSSREPGKGGR
jgi:hypothetical protein